MQISDFRSVRDMQFSFLYIDEMCKGIEWQRVMGITQGAKCVEWVIMGQKLSPIILQYNPSNELYSMLVHSAQYHALHAYYTGKFPLSRLEMLPQLNGLMYADLDAQHQRKIEGVAVHCKVINTEDEAVAGYFGEMMSNDLSYLNKYV